MEAIFTSLQNQWPAESEVWLPLLPALLAALIFLVGFVIYNVRVVIVGRYHDAEIESRGSSFLANMYVRQYFAWLMQPLWRFVLRTGVPATVVTTLSVLLATASGVLVSMGYFATGGWLYIFAGICDFLDGRLARAKNEASKSGAALDSILDRYSDSAVLVGLAWFYRDSWVLLATQLALVGSSLIPYIRARGEVAGVAIKGVGLMQRTERILYLGAAVAMSPVFEAVLGAPPTQPPFRLAVVGLVLLAISTQVTALQRFVHLLGALDERAWHLGWLAFGRGSLSRSACVAAVATCVDFLVASALVMQWSPPLATFIANLVGAVISFSLHRMWVFGARGARLPQVGRYTFASVTSALLNAGGVVVLMLLPGVGYVVAWALVHVAVFAAWNFPLFRRGYAMQTKSAGVSASQEPVL